MLIASGSILLSCNPLNESTRNSKEADTLTYDVRELKLVSEHVVEQENTTDTTYFKANYPFFADTALDQYVQELIVLNDNPDNQFHTIQAQGESFITDFNQYFSDSEHVLPWLYEVNTGVIVNEKNYLSFKTNYSTYQGGAHGNHGILFANYDPVERRALTLHDFVKEEHHQELLAMAEQLFRDQEGLAEDQSLDDYFFEDNAFALNNNFTFTDTGLLFLYNVYEIKPYVDGTTELLIPYQDLSGIMTEKGLKITDQGH